MDLAELLNFHQFLKSLLQTNNGINTDRKRGRVLWLSVSFLKRCGGLCLSVRTVTVENIYAKCFSFP